MNEKTNTPLFILGIAIISFIVGFIFGSAYGEGRWIKIAKYCINQNTVKSEILNCIQGVLDEEKEEVESSRDY